MCGIAGIVKWTHEAPPPWLGEGAENAKSLRQMSGALSHRGPDGDGLWTDYRPNYTVALIHRRLAIIDLPCGAQPMPNETRNVWVVFNGEIYNHAALRAELRAAGHVFASDHSDTEVLVHGWEQWGTELPKKLVGMFAFGIWDQRGGADTLFLARDRMGQKPLFYATLEDGIVFGSTIGSVLAWPEVPRRVPQEQIGLYLLLGYFPAPQTIWRDISQVMPGGWLRVRKDLVDGGMYWEKGEMEKQESGSRNQEAGEHLRLVLEEAVRSQLMADVPIACFLSGGIDSSIIAALMQKTVRAAGGGAIQTVSVGFSESGFDETAYAATVAERIGSRHTRLEVHADGEVFATLQLLMAKSLGQPFADSSILPTYYLSGMVREIAPVALSGDGADELFGGYDRYRALVTLDHWRAASRLARFLPKAMPVGSLAKQEKYRRLAAAVRAEIPSEQYTRLVEIFPLSLAEELLGESIMDYFPLPEEYGLDEDVSPLRLAMRRDQQEYLPGDVLWKVDSASMAEGLEVRSPFLDHRVVALANGLDDQLLVRGGTGKLILRQTFAPELPDAVKNRGKKGFGLPIGDWFRTTLRQSLTDLLFSGDSFTSTHLQKRVAERLVDEHVTGRRDHTHRLFALVMLEFWHRQFSPKMEANAD